MSERQETELALYVLLLMAYEAGRDAALQDRRAGGGADSFPVTCSNGSEG